MIVLDWHLAITHSRTRKITKVLISTNSMAWSLGAALRHSLGNKLSWLDRKAQTQEKGAFQGLLKPLFQYSNFHLKSTSSSDGCARIAWKLSPAWFWIDYNKFEPKFVAKTVTNEMWSLQAWPGREACIDCTSFDFRFKGILSNLLLIIQLTSTMLLINNPYLTTKICKILKTQWPTLIFPSSPRLPQSASELKSRGQSKGARKGLANGHHFFANCHKYWREKKTAHSYVISNLICVISQTTSFSFLFYSKSSWIGLSHLQWNLPEAWMSCSLI